LLQEFPVSEASLPERLTAALADRYTLIREIGQGGMATVYLARDLANERDVALKVLLPDLASALGPERFRREIDVASALKHPNILGIYDSGEAAGTLYYTMPFVDGESLRARLDREKQLAVPEALRIASDVAVALDVAHEKGIVHRDIKPENILLDTTGRVIVADFGIARAVNAAGDERLTKTGITLGTPAYMSPEQATAERHIDGRSDIYALGCILYEMLAGTPPFTGPNAQAITARHLMDEPPNITTMRRTVPQHVDQTIRVALAKAPADRFTKATEFVDALKDASGKLVGQYTASMPIQYQTGAGRAPAKQMSPVMMKVAMIALPIVLLAGGFFGWRQMGGQGGGGPIAATVMREARVAVMYFDDATGGELGFAADGFTETLIEELGSRQVNVISTNGVLPFRGIDDHAEAVRRLRARMLVVGRVETNGDSLRVRVRVLNDSLRPLDSLVVTVERDDLIGARRQLTSQVSYVVLQRIGLEVQAAQRREGTRSGEAWGLLQRAERSRKLAAELFHAGDRRSWELELRRADSLLDAAASADPRWADPLVQRARIANERGRYADDRIEMVERYREGATLADRAIGLDSLHSGAFEIRGTLRYRLHNFEARQSAARQLFDLAEADVRRSTSLNRKNATAWYVLSHMRAAESDLTESTMAAREALEADEFMQRAPEIMWQLFATHYSLGQFPQSREQCDDGSQRFPDNPLFIQCQLWMMTTRVGSADPGRARELIARLEQSRSAADWEIAEARMLLAAVMARAARQNPAYRDSARAILASARPDRSVDPTGRLMPTEAFVRTLMGDQDEAIRLLERYFVENPAERRRFGRDNDWWWHDLQADPRFIRLIGG
jgi:eukaryotic-like serine/threonine-protein kinase